MSNPSPFKMVSTLKSLHSKPINLTSQNKKEKRETALSRLSLNEQLQCEVPLRKLTNLEKKAKTRNKHQKTHSSVVQLNLGSTKAGVTRKNAAFSSFQTTSDRKNPGRGQSKLKTEK